MMRTRAQESTRRGDAQRHLCRPSLSLPLSLLLLCVSLLLSSPLLSSPLVLPVAAQYSQTANETVCNSYETIYTQSNDRQCAEGEKRAASALTGMNRQAG